MPDAIFIISKMRYYFRHFLTYIFAIDAPSMFVIADFLSLLFSR